MFKMLNKPMGQIFTSLNCVVQKIIIAKYRTSTKLPNVAILARSLSNNELQNMKYDLETSSWYEYKDNIWARILESEALQKVWIVLENDSNIVDKLTPEYTTRVLKSLMLCSGTKIKLRKEQFSSI